MCWTTYSKLSATPPKAQQSNGFRVMRTAGLTILPGNIPLRLAFRFSYACRYALMSYAASRRQDLIPGEQQVVACLLLCYVAERVSPGRFSDYMELLKQLQASCAPHYATPTLVFRDAWWFAEWEVQYIRLPQSPLWMVVMSILLGEIMPIRMAPQPEYVSKIWELLGSLRSDRISVEGAFTLTLFTSWYSIGMIVPGQPLSTDGMQLQCSQLTLRCTLESIVCLLLPETGYPERGMSGVGAPPQPMRWKPQGVEGWSDVSEVETSELWLFEDGRYRINGDYEVQLTEAQLGDLSEQERATLRLHHEEKSPGRFEVFLVRR